MEGQQGSDPTRRGLGFTLIELVMVLVILGIIASVGVPRFFSTQSFRNDFYYDDLMGALRYAQRLAVASGCPVQIQIAGAGFSLSQRVACQTGAFAQPVANPGTGEASYTGVTPAGLAVASTLDPVIFDALGRALDGGLNVSDVTVTVGGRSIQLSGETGFAWNPAI